MGIEEREYTLFIMSSKIMVCFSYQSMHKPIIKKKQQMNLQLFIVIKTIYHILLKNNII